VFSLVSGYRQQVNFLLVAACIIHALFDLTQLRKLFFRQFCHLHTAGIDIGHVIASPPRILQPQPLYKAGTFGYFVPFR